MEMRPNTLNWEQINGWKETVVQNNDLLGLEFMPHFNEMFGS